MYALYSVGAISKSVYCFLVVRCFAVLFLDKTASSVLFGRHVTEKWLISLVIIIIRSQNNNNDDCKGLWRSGLVPCFRRSAKAKVALVQGCEWTRAASVLSTRVTRGMLAPSAVANT